MDSSHLKSELVAGLIVRGHKDLAPSVCLSIHHTLLYRVFEINSSHSFQWIFLKPCILVVDIMKMCMSLWAFDGARINFDRNTTFQT